MTVKQFEFETIEFADGAKVYFKAGIVGLYQPMIKTTKEEIKIPLLLDFHQIEPTINKLKHLCDKSFPIEALRLIVAGACSLTMKRG